MKVEHIWAHKDILVYSCKEDVTLVGQQWSYVFLVLIHRFVVSNSDKNGCEDMEHSLHYLAYWP